MKHKNNHARSKQKRKQLRMKSLLQSIADKRYEKIKKAHKPGETIYLQTAGDKMSNYAVHISALFPNSRNWWNFGTHHARNLNQRQKRKRSHRHGTHGAKFNNHKKLRKAA